MRAFPRPLILLGLFAAALSPSRADEAEERLLKLVSFTEPKDWSKEVREFAGESSLLFRKDIRTIRVQLFGGKHSRYPTAKEFLQSPEARDEGDPAHPAAKAGSLDVGGKPMASYKCTTLRLFGDPSVKFPPPLRTPVEENFVVVPTGDRFFVLRFALEAPSTLTKEDREQKAADWVAFLKSFQLKGTSRAK